MLNKDSLQVLRKYKEIWSCACLVVFCTVFVDFFFYLGNYQISSESWRINLRIVGWTDWFCCCRDTRSGLQRCTF
jgi:hypothetical protein